MGRGFGALWSANAASNLADGLGFVALPLLAASLTDDARLVAGLATTHAVVRLLVALPIGVDVDRLDRRAILVAANLLRGAVMAALAVAVHAGTGSLALLYVATAVVGTLENAADNAAVTILPSIVDRTRLDAANGRISAAQLVADEFVGPPLAGFLFAVAVALPVAAMGGLWAAAALVALGLPRRPAARGPRAAADGSVFGAAATGVRWLARHRTVGAIALIGALASVGYMLPFSVLVVIARDRLGLDGVGYGALLAFSALGGLVGAAVTARLRARLGYRRTITASLVTAVAALLALSATTNAVAAGVALAVYILHAVVWGICATSLRQRLVPDELLGRVNAATRVLGLLGLAVGGVLGGLLVGVDLVLPTVAGAAVFAGCAVVALVAVPGDDALTPGPGGPPPATPTAH